MNPNSHIQQCLPSPGGRDPHGGPGSPSRPIVSLWYEVFELELPLDAAWYVLSVLAPTRGGSHPRVIGPGREGVQLEHGPAPTVDGQGDAEDPNDVHDDARLGLLDKEAGRCT